MASVSAPIVGAKFRPPATLVLANLGLDTPLILVREADNPHDGNAIKACLPAGFEPGETLAQELAEAGERPDFSEPFHLGYIPRGIALDWAPVFDQALAEGKEIPPARLGFTGGGAPMATMDIPEEEPSEGNGYNAQDDGIEPVDYNPAPDAGA